MDIFKKCNCALLFSDDPYSGVDANFYKHSNCEIDNSILLLCNGKKLLIANKMNEREARQKCKFAVKSLFSRDVPAFLKKKISKTAKIGLDFEAISSARYFRLKKIFGPRLVDISEELEQMRLQKTQEEISNLKTAVKIAKTILNGLKLSPSMSELDVQKSLHIACLQKGVEFSFPPIIASGKNSANPHHKPCAKKLGNGIVLIDFGVKYKGYCSDLSRCFFLGECKKEKEKYAQAKLIFSKLVDSFSSVRTIGQVAQIGDMECKKLGWPPMIHSFGHGIGIKVHDAPPLYSKSKQMILPNMALAIEPGYYCNQFGVRFEDNILIGKKGAKLLQ
ncbi:MAG: Xaa-Pro peptidase family protein [Candidatus Micrarchaeia archaeon]